MALEEHHMRVEGVASLGWRLLRRRTGKTSKTGSRVEQFQKRQTKKIVDERYYDNR